MDAVGSTFAVAVTWLVVGLLVAGIGRATMRLLARLAANGNGDARSFSAELWLGLAALLAYLQLWNVFFALSWTAWLAPVAVAVAGFLDLPRRVARLQPDRRALIAGGIAVLGVLWIANQALGAARDYDLGLYHLNLVEYAKHYATIPGLANLQSRLGASDPQLLLVAFLDHGPWTGAALHLVDGLLVALLFVELASRLARRHPGAPSFTRRMAFLLVPAAVVVFGSGLGYRLSSPNLDSSVFVLIVVGMLYLADCVEYGFRLVPAAVCLATLSAASATRPLYWLDAAVAAAILVRSAWRTAGGRPLALRRVGALAALPVLLGAGCLIRQSILSGYPLYPLTIVRLPVDWRVPSAVIHAANRWTASWARWPGKTPAQVLGSWSWLSGYWLRAQNTNFDVLAPLALLACLIPSLVHRRWQETGLSSRTRPMLAVALPSLATLIVWFLAAPDVRFATAPIWLLPIALVAWLVPPLERLSWLLLGAVLVVGFGLAQLEINKPSWFLAAVLLIPVYVLLVAFVIRRSWARPLAVAALLSVGVASITVVVHRGALRPVHANAGGRFGTPPEEVPATISVTLSSGLQITEPTPGSDQCFAQLLCTPALADSLNQAALTGLRLRGPGVGSGFSAGT